MNIEEAIRQLEIIIMNIAEERKNGIASIEGIRFQEAIETLLTAYEEKEERCNFLDKELYNANQEIQDLQLNIEKEKEKNKKAIDFINDKNNYFEDGENWQNILKIKEILEE